jgi:vitamin B12 transporter
MIIKKCEGWVLRFIILGLIFVWVLPVAATETKVNADTTTERRDRKKKKNTETMEEMVVTGTRSEEKITSIPTKVELIKGETIEMTVGETITEQLKKNASIGVVEYPGALAGIGIRGFKPEFFGITQHSLILINGRPSGVTNLAGILSDNIERIEVLKGPASSLYGGEAMGGVVNIITKKNRGELTGMAELGYGSFETNFQKGAIGGRIIEGLDFDLNARRYEQADDLIMGNGHKRANTTYNTQNANIRLGKDLGEAWRLDLSGDIYQGRDIETPGDTFDGNLKSGTKDIDHYGLDAVAEGQLGRHNTLTLTAYTTNEASDYYNRYIDNEINPIQVPAYRFYDSETEWVGLQVKDAYMWKIHRFIVGVDYQDIEKKSRSYTEEGERQAPYSPDEGRTNRAGYLETIWKFMDQKLTATMGGRYDSFDVETKSTPYKDDFTPNSESFSAFSPRTGLNYKFDQGIRLHTTVGKAFVPPSAWELAGYSETKVDGGTEITRGNSKLDPESSTTYDLGAGYDQPLFGLYADLTYFHTNVEDKITEVKRGDITTFANSLNAEMEGLEALLSFDIGAPLNWDRFVIFFVNATYMLTAEEEEEKGVYKDIQNVADYTVNYGVQYEDGTFDGKLHVRNQGPMRDTDQHAADGPELEYPSFTVVDLVVGMTFLEHHRITLKADNILDEDYYEKKGYPKPGRAFFASYQYMF